MSGAEIGDRFVFSAADRPDRDSDFSRCSPKWRVVVNLGETQCCRELQRCGKSFKGEKVESSSGMNKLGHGPAECPKRDQFNGVGKFNDRAEHGRGHRIINGAKLPRNRPDNVLVGQGSTETVVPQACCGDCCVRGTELWWLVAEQDT